MKLFLFSTTVLVGAKAQETNCAQVHEVWYGNSCSSAMTCSDTYACVVPEDCTAYSCVQQCPEGTDFLPFYPNDGPQAGYACIPKDRQNPYFECDFDESGDFTLRFNGRVPEINKAHARDDREITQISWDAWNNYRTANPNMPVTELFANSTCVGFKNGASVEFNNIESGENGCEFTNMGMETGSTGIPYYTQKLVVGYDDFVEYLPNNGPIVVKKYGASWIINCRIKAWDTGYVNPGAAGERDEYEEEIETEMPFTVKMYRDDTFETEINEDDVIDLGPESLESQKIYVETKAEIPESQSDGKMNMIHVRHCKLGQMSYDADTGDWTTVDYNFDFVVDGCLKREESFIDNNFGMTHQRTQFRNNSKTYIVDQFEVDLWDPNYGSASNNIKIEVECEMVACEVDEFSRTDSDYTQALSFCYLDDNCKNDDDTRYSNLMESNLRSRNIKKNVRSNKFQRSTLKKVRGGIRFQMNEAPPCVSGPGCDSAPGSALKIGSVFALIISVFFALL